jgi:hypothetical protein
VFDREQLSHSFGYQELDAVGQEAFVNHIHFEGENREHQAKELVQDWIEELREKWSQDRCVGADRPTAVLLASLVASLLGGRSTQAFGAEAR